MKTPKVKYNTWTRIPWDGNPEMKLECWRKSFRNGHVSVCIGACELIVYNYGPNSEFSMSSTRKHGTKDADGLWRQLPTQTEEEAMAMVDALDGFASQRDKDSYGRPY